MTTSVVSTSGLRQLIADRQATSSSRRKITNTIMLSLTGLMTLLALIPLFFVLFGFLVPDKIEAMYPRS